MSKVALKHQKKHIAKHHLKQPTLLISEKATDIYIINIWYDDDDDAAAPALASDSLAAHNTTPINYRKNKYTTPPPPCISHSK